MISILRPLLVLFFGLSLLTGIIYPLAVTGIGKLAFADQVAGSVITEGGAAVGSTLISQSFQDPKYFWGRLSATSADPDNTLPIPVDLVTASGSGLDPEISPAAALYQVARVARARHLDAVKLRQNVLAAVQPPQWHIFGESRVNVLLLNLALDRAQ
jgi:K+-transporting ATPase ATPase C chain